MSYKTGPYKRTQIAELDAYPKGTGVHENEVVYPGTHIYSGAGVHKRAGVDNVVLVYPCTLVYPDARVDLLVEDLHS